MTDCIPCWRDPWQICRDQRTVEATCSDSGTLSRAREALQSNYVSDTNLGQHESRRNERKGDRRGADYHWAVSRADARPHTGLEREECNRGKQNRGRTGSGHQFTNDTYEQTRKVGNGRFGSQRNCIIANSKFATKSMKTRNLGEMTYFVSRIARGQMNCGVKDSAETLMTWSWWNWQRTRGQEVDWWIKRCKDMRPSVWYSRDMGRQRTREESRRSGEREEKAE